MKQKITRLEDVRAGDKITVRTEKRPHQVPGDVVTATASVKNGLVFALGWPVNVGCALEFVSAEREVPDLPSGPGAYIDRDGAIVVRYMIDGPDHWAFDGTWVDDEFVRGRLCLPLTRMVPEGSEPQKIAKWLIEATNLATTATSEHEKITRAIQDGAWKAEANHE